MNKHTASTFERHAEREAPPRAGRCRGARRAFGSLRRAVGLAGGALVAISVIKELRRPMEQRTWHGTVLGFVPYDFRPPTMARLRAAYWNPESHRLLSGRVFGAGWALNLYEVVARVRGQRGWPGHASQA